MNTAPTATRSSVDDPSTAHVGAAAAVAAAPVEPALLAPIDRAVLALGTALVSWSRRAERRGGEPVTPAAGATDTAGATAAVARGAAATGVAAAVLQAADADALRERHHLRRETATARVAILAERDLGINSLLR
ncbi:MAG: hypothetical protein JWR01_31 [Subtercola sp.]|nr:hypothetical protein [Subtercola sp.]